MIIKIDHITLAPKCFDEDIEFFSQLGYKLSFTEKDIPNPIIKKKLMNKWSDMQDLAFMESEGNFNIELVNHNIEGSTNDLFIPIFEGAPDELFVKVENLSFTNEVVISAMLKRFDMSVIMRDIDAKTFRFNKLIIKSKDMAKSAEFWESLGFKAVNRWDHFLKMEFASMLYTNKLSLYLSQDTSKEQADFRLDNKGFNCIAFITNSVHKEKKRLTDLGYGSTEIETIEINKKTLDVCFVKGPSGELIELIGIAK